MGEKKKENPILKQMSGPLQKQIFGQLESFMPIIKEAVPFVSNKIDEFLSDGKMIVIKKIGTKVYGIIVNTNEFYSITNNESIAVPCKDLDGNDMLYSTDKLVQMIMSGQLG